MLNVISEEMKKKKTLIFGGSGLVGSRISELLSDRITVFSPTRKEVDINEIDQVKRAINNIMPDWIIYAAGVTNPDEAEQQKEHAMAINATVPGVITKIARTSKIPMLYFSSDSVFSGAQMDRPYTEDDSLDPVNFYGLTKKIGEEYVLDAFQKNCVVRIITVYSHFSKKKLDIARLAVQSFQQSNSFSGIIDQYMNPTYVDDIAKGVSRIIERDINGVLHFGASDFMTNYDFIKTIAHSCGFGSAKVQRVTLKTFNKNKNAKRGQYVWLNTNKARNLLGEDTISSISEGISRFWQNLMKSR